MPGNHNSHQIRENSRLCESKMIHPGFWSAPYPPRHILWRVPIYNSTIEQVARDHSESPFKTSMRRKLNVMNPEEKMKRNCDTFILNCEESIVVPCCHQLHIVNWIIETVSSNFYSLHIATFERVRCAVTFTNKKTTHIKMNMPMPI